MPVLHSKSVINIHSKSMNFINKLFRKSRSKPNGIFCDNLQKIIGYQPRTYEYYLRAFTHASMQEKDENGSDVNYERLEFLGDSVLNTVISSFLFENAPQGNEGYLTVMRSKIVSRKHLNHIGEELNLISLLMRNIPDHQLGKNITGNLFEALIGAIYLDQGYDFSENFIKKYLIDRYVDLNELEKRVTSYKSLVIKWCQKNKYDFEFCTKIDDGCDEQQHFSVCFYIDDEIVSKARETSKKRAEEKAAKRAYYALQNEIQTKKLNI